MIYFFLKLRLKFWTQLHQEGKVQLCISFRCSSTHSNLASMASLPWNLRHPCRGSLAPCLPETWTYSLAVISASAKNKSKRTALIPLQLLRGRG